MHVLNVLKIYVTDIEENGSFFMLKFIRRVLKILTILGVCSIIVLCQEYAK